MNARLRGLFVLYGLLCLSLGRAGADDQKAEHAAIDYAKLAEPKYANSLDLTDEQRASLAKILDERIAALAARPDDRAKILSDSNQQLRALLSDDQRTKFEELLSGGKLRFNFRQQEWPDVLDWFARQADLSLVMDASPPGTFTYSDDKEHTATQAIDLLNSVLLSKGFALVRRDQMLLVVDVSEGVPFEMVPQIEMDDLPQRGRFELVTLEIPLGGRPVDACVSAVQGLIGKHGRVTPLAAAGKLLVTETAGKLRAVNLLISSIPVPAAPPAPPPPAVPPAPPVFASYSVKGLDVAATVVTLKELFTAATVKPDPVAEEVHVYAPPAVQATIKESIDKMLINAQGDAKPRLEIYPIEAGDISQLQSQLTAAVPQARITADANQRRLLVIANETQHAEVRQALEKLGVESASETGEATFEIYKVSMGNTASLEKLLQQALPRAVVIAQSGRIAVRAWPQEQEIVRKIIDDVQETKEERTLATVAVPDSEATGILAAVKNLIPSATASLDSTHRRLIVIGTPEEHRQASDLAAKLGGDGEQSPSVLIGYSLKQADAAAVVKMLQDLRPDVRIGADTRANRVLVTAPLQEQPRLKAVIEELDAAPDSRQEELIRKYRLKMMNPATVVTLIQPLVPAMKLTADPATKQILATGTELSHHKLNDLLQRIDGDEASPAEVRTYEIGNADAEQVRNVLLQLAPAAVISATRGVPRLLVWAGETDHALIKDAVRQFTELSPDQSRSLEIYPQDEKIAPATLSVLQSIVPSATLTLESSGKRLISWATAKQQADVKAALERLTQWQSQAGDRVLRSHAVREDVRPVVRKYLHTIIDGIEFLEAAAGNQLICWATEADHARIAEQIKHFERELKVPGERTLQIHHLKSATPAAATTVLNESLKNLTFLSSPQPTQLLILATDEQHGRIEEILQQLETASGTLETTLKVYPIERNRMAAQAMLTALGAETTSGAVIQVNPETNSLIVRAEESVHARLKDAMAVLLDQLPVAELKTHVYRLKRSSPQAAGSVLAGLVPQAKLAVDEKGGTLAATATAADQERIRGVVDQMDFADQDASLLTKIYRFRRMSATTAQSAFQNLAPGSRIAADANANVVVATASAADHDLFRDAAEKLDGQPGGSIVRVYPFESGKVSAATVLSFLDRDLKDSVSIQLNEAVNSLIVRGDDESHAKLRQAVDSLIAQIPAPTGKDTQVYPLEHASADMVQRTVAPLIPNGTAVADAANSALLVTASDYDQKRVADVIAKLDTVPVRQRVMKAYPVRHADAASVYQTVAQGFSQNSEFAITFQPTTATLFVLASPKNQDTFRQLLEELDQPGEIDQRRVARTYPLGNASGSAAASAVRALYQGRNVTVELDSRANTLVVVADEAQHQVIADTLEQLEGEEREFGVFELMQTDVFVAENAIQDLFGDAGGKNGPSVSSDFESQKLYVRGTSKQLEQIRKLLATLGEAPADGPQTRQTGDVRTIPFAGDTRAAAEQLRLIWPRVRSNRIEVITPSRSGLRGVRPSQPPSAEPIPEPSKEASPEERKGAAREPSGRPPRIHLAAMQTSIRSGNPGTAEQKRPPADAAGDADDSQPPVVIVPGEGQMTIMSPDHEALDQMESLLRAMSRGDGRGRNSSNLSVFLLRNTGAAEVQRVLKQLIDDQRSVRNELGDVTIASDERLNALIVHGSRKSRELVEQLLEVLDTNELPAPLVDQSPILIPLQNVQARRVRTILSTVYKTQLTTGGGRREVQIPKGVSPDVASVLQQINAASAGPVLSLEVDDTTNSLIMRAPPELSREIEQFVQRLDQQASDTSHRRVRIIKLNQNKSDRMQQVLQQFLLQSSGSGARDSKP